MTIHVHPQRTSIFIFIFCGTKKCTILNLENVSIGIVATMIKTGCWGLSVLRILTISCLGENQNKENEMFSDEISQQTFKFGLENSMATSAHDFTRKQSHPQAPNVGYFSSKCFITQFLENSCTFKDSETDTSEMAFRKVLLVWKSMPIFSFTGCILQELFGKIGYCRQIYVKIRVRVFIH